MFIDSGEYVTWSVFDDIDFGELDFIRQFVTYTAARKTPEELPKSVFQFFDEAEELTVSVAHDQETCPYSLGEGLDHEACWRITLPSRCPTPVKEQLDKPLTGEEVNGLLSPGRIFVKGKLYTFDIKPPTMSEFDESIVFHEERYIRILLRSLGVLLKPLEPGSFLKVTNQQWIISITWDGSHFNWEAQSVVSNLVFGGGDQTIELVHGNSAQKECERLLDVITSSIPKASIRDYENLKETVLSTLNDGGYSETSPLCELRFIEQSDNVCRYGVFLVEGFAREPFETYSIEADRPVSHDEILMGIESGLSASAYNIVNTEEFQRKLATWVKKNIPDADERAEETEVWTVTLALLEDFEDGVIHWTAEYGELCRTGVIHMVVSELRGLDEEAACEDVRRTFEIEVVKELQFIRNLDEVLDEQVPEMIRVIREESDEYEGRQS